MREYCLQDIIRIKHGFPFSGDHIVQDDNGIVLVTPGNFKIGGGFQENKCKFYTGEIPYEYILKPGSYIVTMTDLSKNIDTLGYSAIVPNTQRVYLHNQRIGLIEFINTSCNEKYIYYLLQTHQYQKAIANTSTGSTVHHTSPSKICAYKFYAPDVDIQKRISDILSAYDDLIENNQKQIKLLEEAAQRLYKEWFVDLRFPGFEHTKILDGVPERWKVYRFSDKVEIMSGGTPKTDNPNYYNGTIPFYTPKDSPDTFFSFKTITNITQEGLNNCNSRLYPEDTVIITARGTVGKTTLLAVPMAMNQSCYALKSDEISAPYYLFFALKQEIALLKVMSNGGVFDTIIVKTFDSIHITIPSNNLIAKFQTLVTPIMEQIKVKSKEIFDLSEARDRLLPKLMSGEVEV